MHWKRKSWMLIGVLLAACSASVTAQIVTTQVADTVYRADGTAASGSVLISWPAFTTTSGTAVPSGNTSSAIATGGALSVQLAPNAGANPVGTYYTVVYHLDDGTVSRQYWVVPASTTAVRISAIESTVVPISVAMQTVSKSYVDTAIAAAIAALTGGGGSAGVQLGGDLGGTNSAPIVAGIRGHPVSSTAPSTGQTLVWSGSAYAPATPGSGFAAGGDLSGNTSSQTVVAIQGKPVSATEPTTGQTLTWNGTAYVPTTVLGGVGPAGPTGPTGPPANFAGAWASGTTYSATQAVSYTNGNSYVSLIGSNTGNEPDTSPSDWGLLASASGGSVVVNHSFGGAGTFNYNHGLGTLYPLMTCYVNSGYPSYTAANVDTNNVAITVIAASNITCTFGR